MKAAKWIGIALVGYIGIVVVFESMIGVFQPEAGTTLVITSSDADGKAGDRVVSRLESSGQLYVAANHWPRSWYKRALANPDVSVVVDGVRSDRRAVPVEGAEHDRINTEHALPLPFRLVTGFPPRYLLRLDPR
jgi:hypothetical protein